MSKIVTTPSSEKLISRLANWKFCQALSHLKGQPQDVCDVIQSLGDTFGDCGWFEGRMGIIIGAALEGIGFSVEAEDPDNMLTFVASTPCLQSVDNVCLECQDCQGARFPKGHGFWRTHTPPLHEGCTCYLTRTP